MRPRLRVTLFCLAAAAALAGCDAQDEPAAAEIFDAPLTVDVVPAVERPLARYLEVTGTLAADESADVAAEVQGRVVGTPVERGTRVAEGDPLIRIAAAEMEAQLAEADANAAQIAGRLGMGDGSALDVDRVPEVANARATLDLALADFERARTLFDQQLVSPAELDQRSAQAEVARRQYDIARSAAMQQYQALLGARARVTLARKALDDTVVRAPFAGVVGQRLVSVGDYVTRGTKVASVMRTHPLRVHLTVPEQYSAEVAVGRTVALEVDAARGRVFTGQVRYVSPALQSDSRTLVVEALVPNSDGALRPGSFATARIQQASDRPALVVPASAVRTVSGTSRVFVLAGGRVEERIVTLGRTEGDLVEIGTGLQAAEDVVVSDLERLADGVRATAGR